eukprot:4290902-Pleurochrysis_carterae.AAC.5
MFVRDLAGASKLATRCHLMLQRCFQLSKAQRAAWREVGKKRRECARERDLRVAQLKQFELRRKGKIFEA